MKTNTVAAIAGTLTAVLGLLTSCGPEQQRSRSSVENGSGGNLGEGGTGTTTSNTGGMGGTPASTGGKGGTPASTGGMGGTPASTSGTGGAVAPAGLVAHWTFDEVDASKIVRDEAGLPDYGNLLNPNPDSGFAFGRKSRAYNFRDGSYFRVEPSVDINSIKEKLTIAFWFRWNGSGGIRAIVKRPVGTTNDEYYGVYTNDGGELRFQSGGRLAITAMNLLQNGLWAHIAITYDQPANTVIAYKNGVEVSKVTNFSGKTFSGDTSWLAIGCNVTAGACTGSYLDAWMDDLRMYNTVLSAAQIVELTK